jgi:hypothetical protein
VVRKLVRLGLEVRGTSFRSGNRAFFLRCCFIFVAPKLVVFRITFSALARETFEYPPPPHSVGGYLTVFCVCVYLCAFSAFLLSVLSFSSLWLSCYSIGGLCFCARLLVVNLSGVLRESKRASRRIQVILALWLEGFSSSDEDKRISRTLILVLRCLFFSWSLLLLLLSVVSRIVSVLLRSY